MSENQPDWGKWDLELSPHLLKRMEDRRFTELDLRAMLERSRAMDPDLVEGRWVISTDTGARPGRSSSSRTGMLRYWS